MSDQNRLATLKAMLDHLSRRCITREDWADHSHMPRFMVAGTIAGREPITDEAWRRLCEGYRAAMILAHVPEDEWVAIPETAS